MSGIYFVDKAGLPIFIYGLHLLIAAWRHEGLERGRTLQSWEQQFLHKQILSVAPVQTITWHRGLYGVWKPM